MLILSGLKDLYKSMRKNNIERYKFSFTFRGVNFDVMYFIDDNPHILAIGIVAENYYFEVEVKNGFKIIPYIDNINRFCRILNFEYNPTSPFKPAIFFKELNSKIPKNANKQNIPKPHEIGQYRRNVEEADKIYFCGWRDNNARGHRVSKENLEKTRKLLSYKAYEMCKKKNISSLWTDDPNKAKNFSLPS
ncbi:DUF6037 family protein [Aeribacillus sp. FSL K6-2848]|uniref:DUF6037 family protein n=1 Tax=unclassified Aeribacillus TaxID=2640495 RepID=UPI0030CE273D